MKLILREWPPTPVIDVGINMDALHGAFFRDINDSASQQALKSIHKKYWLLCTCNIKNPAALTVRRINEINILGHTSGGEFNAVGDFVSSRSSVNNNYTSLSSQATSIDGNRTSIQATGNDIASTTNDVTSNTNNKNKNKAIVERNSSAI